MSPTEVQKIQELVYELKIGDIMSFSMGSGPSIAFHSREPQGFHET